MMQNLDEALSFAIVAKVRAHGGMRLDEVEQLADALGIPPRGLGELTPGDLGLGGCNRPGLVSWVGMSNDITCVLSDLISMQVLDAVPTAASEYCLDHRHGELPVAAQPLDSRYDKRHWLPVLLVLSARDS